MTIWQFSLQSGKVTHGRKQRRMLSSNGCNEPFKDRFWCPKSKWFSKEPCPFMNRHECHSYARMCSENLASY